MTPMSAAILDRSGTIDKYIGDCVMAFWNAPLPVPDHAARACAGAIDMVQRLRSLNATLRVEQGEIHADYQAAKALIEGDGAGRDAARAAALFRAEAERGYANAQYNLAKACRDGVGVPQDQREATRWFRAAAEQGHARSQERLGARLADGIGAVRDAIEGAAWLSLAAAQGLGSATVALERVLAGLDAPARNAVQRQARAIRPRLARRGAFELQCGVGLNTGTCIVGNMGSDQRFDYSALGDAVNLASRLEALTKSYGVDIVAGESTRDAAPDFAWLELDLIAVKGRTEVSRVFALLGDADAARDAAFQAQTAAHMRMLGAYRSQSWIEARALLAECRAGGRLQDLYDLYAERIDTFEQQPPGPDWRGVAQAETK
jgi:adenylate cyclase